MAKHCLEIESIRMVCCGVFSYRELQLTAICGVIGGGLVLGYHVPLLIDETSPVSILPHNILMMIVGGVAACLHLVLAFGACCRIHFIVIIWLALIPLVVAGGITAVVLKITGAGGKIKGNWLPIVDLIADCMYLLSLSVTWVSLVVSKRAWMHKREFGKSKHVTVIKH